MASSRTVLSKQRADRLRERLDALSASVDVAGRLAADPIAFAHRYADPRDQELAGLYAALLAYGRVDLFRPVLRTLFDTMDHHGGPHAFVTTYEVDEPSLWDLRYRFNRGEDWVLLTRVLRRVLEDHGSVQALFVWRRSHGDVGPALGGAIAVLRGLALAEAHHIGASVTRFDDLPRGFRYFLSSPDGGSACKRWNMYLRWMVRRDDGIDLGLWSAVPAHALVVPLDTHVARIARLVGLTRRTDGSWRTAVEITRNLRRLDPEDPVRYDFALAHLGISGACKARRDPIVCPSCPLEPICTA